MNASMRTDQALYRLDEQSKLFAERMISAAMRHVEP